MRPADGGPPIRGLLQIGNIDLLKRPVVRNPDGSVSTVRSFSRGTDQGEVLVPQVVGKRVLSREAAWQHYLRTGRHLGIFKTPADATVYANALHKDQAEMYARHPLTSALVRSGGVR